jgi:protoheme IX farnesyltransferase
MRHLFLAVFAVLLSSRVNAESRFDFATTPGKLPKDVRPTEYSIRIAPDLQNLTFTGSETVRLHAKKPVSKLVLNALEASPRGSSPTAGCAATINHVLDRRIDEQMARTRRRPLPTGHLAKRQAVLFATLLGLASMLVLWLLVNGLTAALTFCSLIGYAMVYTIWLKRATPQNIVIGGAAGAAPPVLGWAAVTNTIDPHALLLFLIIFTWTPPHFWALAIARRDDYAKVGIPMLPVTHGIPYTRLQIVLYTILLVLSTLLPYLTGMSGFIYLAAAVALNGRFLYYVLALNRGLRPELPMRTFKYSVTYLMLLFAALILDHYFMFKV